MAPKNLTDFIFTPAYSSSGYDDLSDFDKTIYPEILEQFEKMLKLSGKQLNEEIAKSIEKTIADSLANSVK